MKLLDDTLNDEMEWMMGDDVNDNVYCKLWDEIEDKLEPVLIELQVQLESINNEEGENES